MAAPHSLAWEKKADPPAALSEAETKALLGLSYVSPVDEHYLLGRLEVEDDAVGSLIARGLALRDTFRNERGLSVELVMLTLEGARRRRARAQAMDRDPSQQGWRDRQSAAMMKGDDQ